MLARDRNSVESYRDRPEEKWPRRAAIRHNAILKAFYLRLREPGKPAKVALAAVMRKLTVLLNRLLKNPHCIRVS